MSLRMCETDKNFWTWHILNNRTEQLIRDKNLTAGGTTVHQQDKEAEVK